MIIQFLISLFIALFISLITTPLVRNFFIKKNFVEHPRDKEKKSHNATALTAVPRGGGIPVYLAIVVTILFLLPDNKYLIGIIIACTLNLIIGVWDDLKDISPHLRLVTNILTALIIIGSGIGITFISNPFGGIINLSYGLMPYLLAIIWITWCTNIVGWATGVDGQLPGFTAIAAIILGILGIRFSNDLGQLPLIILSGALAGAYLGFLPFNVFPQSIMPGYSGKSLAGMLLGVLSILSGAKLATLILLLGIPMIDAIFVIIRRLLNHRSIFRPDNKHLHHQLLKSGYSRPQIAMFYWGITLLLGSISLFLNSTQKFYTFIGIFILIFFFSWKLSRRI